jgi:hypothetical protein
MDGLGRRPCRLDAARYRTCLHLDGHSVETVANRYTGIALDSSRTPYAPALFFSPVVRPTLRRLCRGLCRFAPAACDPSCGSAFAPRPWQGSRIPLSYFGAWRRFAQTPPSRIGIESGSWRKARSARRSSRRAKARSRRRRGAPPIEAGAPGDAAALAGIAPVAGSPERDG